MVPLFAGLTLSGCGGEGDEWPSIFTTSSGICAGGGCGGTLVSNNVPVTMAPSEKLIVDVVYRNTGTVTWNDQIMLYSRMSPLRLFGSRIKTLVSGTVTPTNEYTFRFVITAPATAGPAVFDYQLFDRQTGQFFGDRVTVTVTIQNQTPQFRCSPVSDTVPGTVVTGASYNVSYEIENTGLQPWTSDFLLCETDGDFWQGNRCSVIGGLAVGARATVNESITAPGTTGTFALTRQVFDFTTGVRLGALSDLVDCVNLNVAVQSSGSQPLDAAEDVGARVVPGVLSPGELSSVTVVMENTGTQTWLADGTFAFIPLTSSTLSAPRRVVDTPTAASGTVSFVFPFQAPSVGGTYFLNLQMNQLGGVGAFGAVVSIPITVSAGTPVFDAAEDVAGRIVPSTMAPNETQEVTIAVRNTGTQTWTTGGAFNLQPTDSNQFGRDIPVVTSNTPQNSVATFNFFITSPATPGNYQLRRTMNNTGGAGLFGSEIIIPITVNATVTPQFDATFVSQVYPSRFTPGEGQDVQITFLNSGTAPWTSSVVLRSQNTPVDLWTRTVAGIGGCDPTPPGNTCTITLRLAAPSVLGTYSSSWRLSESPGVGLFGDTATQNNIEVTFCGNGIVESFTTPPEVCDLGDIVDGDGCSSTCQIEPRTINLASDTIARTFRGSGGNRQAGTVSSGDIDGDSVSELLLGEKGTFRRTVQRASAGRIAVYESAALDNSTTVLPDGANLQVFGADPGDIMGTLAQSRIIAADVTGDGIQDLITSAPFADGPMNTRDNAGEVYVVVGGAALTSTAGVDLAAPASFLGATFEGAAANDNLTVLAAGDVTNDGIADLIFGLPTDDAAGADAGAIIIIEGGASLAAGTTFDLATAPVYATIRGGAAGDRLGEVAIVGDVIGNSTGDLITGANDASPGGLSGAGAVYVFLGPIAPGTYSAPTNRTLEIRGQEIWVRAGSALAVGDVIGSSRQDLIVGVPQTRFGGQQVGTVEIFEGPITVPGGGVIDLAVTNADVRIEGVDPGDRTGGALAVGDFDGNGFDDIAVGAPLAAGLANGFFRSGEVTVVLGAENLPATISLATLQAGQPPLYVYGAVEDRIGSYSHGMDFHDIDADGIDDLCIGVIRAFSGDDGAIYCIRSQFR